MKTALNLYGPINQLGYGQHFMNWAGATSIQMAKMGYQTAVIPKGEILLPRGKTTPNAHAVLMRVSDVGAFDPKAPSIMLWHLHNVAEFTGSKRFMYTVFEGSELSPLEASNLTKIDGLIVPTAWHLERVRPIANRMVNEDFKIWVINEGIDPSVFFFNETPGATRWNQNNEETVFVSVGKLEKRKGMEALVPSLEKAALMTGKRVRLLAHWFNPFFGPGGRDFMSSAIALLSNYGFTGTHLKEDSASIEITKGGSNLTIEVIGRPFSTQEELVELYRSGHWGVFPHYAEGWGLPLQESMACGLPPITNFYSGPTEYLQPGTFLGVESIETLAQCKHFYKRGDVGTWRQVTNDSLTQQLITALQTPEDERVQMAARASKAASVFTWDRAAAQTIAVLREMEVI